jgi:hypothetical protein
MIDCRFVATGTQTWGMAAVARKSCQRSRMPTGTMRSLRIPTAYTSHTSYHRSWFFLGTYNSCFMNPVSVPVTDAREQEDCGSGALTTA